jgi:hypothetical protein
VGEDELIEHMFADYRIARPAEVPLEHTDAFEVRMLQAKKLPLTHIALFDAQTLPPVSGGWVFSSQLLQRRRLPSRS